MSQSRLRPLYVCVCLPAFLWHTNIIWMFIMIDFAVIWKRSSHDFNANEVILVDSNHICVWATQVGLNRSVNTVPVGKCIVQQTKDPDSDRTQGRDRLCTSLYISFEVIDERFDYNEYLNRWIKTIIHSLHLSKCIYVLEFS